MLDTVVTITTYGATQQQLDGAFDLCREYEQLLSRTVEGSDVWRINNADGMPVSVSDKTVELLEMSVEYCSMSDGRFDITIAPVTQLWDFSADSPVIPDEAVLREKCALVDWRAISIDGTRVTLPAGMMLDLGAIAKGYIADRIGEYLEECGVTGAVISLGGNILTVGSKTGSNDTLWNIGIRVPFADYSQQLGTLSLEECSVVTSGIYERCFTVDDTLYHHILDPESGLPVYSGLASVTIISPESAQGDALSTICFLLGEEEGMSLVESLDEVEAVFVREDGSIVCSSGAVLAQSQ